MNIVIAITIIFITFFLLLRNYDYRVVLIASGLLLSGIALDPLIALDEFAFKMATDSLIQAGCATLGFAFVMRATGCEQQLITLVVKRVRGAGYIAIPFVTLLTFVINTQLLSAANTAAAVGIILIPLLIAAGIHPAVAGCAVLAGTFGSLLNPILPTNAFVARVAGVEAQTVTDAQQIPVLVAVVIAALSLTVLSVIRRETSGFELASATHETTEVNPLHALIPLIPLILLFIGSSGLIPTMRMGIAQTMLVGALLGLLATRASAASIADSFFDGMGSAYARIISMIIAVAVFVRGMKSIGVISFLITWLTTSPDAARAGGVFGPFIMGIITGSGDGAAFAFSEGVAPHASLYAMTTVDMGNLAALAGAFGRTMSPLAAATIVCAVIAGVNPVEIAKRNCPGMVIALTAAFIII